LVHAERFGQCVIAFALPRGRQDQAITGIVEDIKGAAEAEDQFRGAGAQNFVGIVIVARALQHVGHLE
jgi:hypothetical protein